MRYGRGIYMSDYPGICLNYGNVLVLCRVLLGRVTSMDQGSARKEFTSEQDSKEVREHGKDVIMRVIKTADQVRLITNISSGVDEYLCNNEQIILNTAK